MPRQNEIQDIVEEVRLVPIAALEKLFKVHPNLKDFGHHVIEQLICVIRLKD
jgi:hypothetical protein